MAICPLSFVLSPRCRLSEPEAADLHLGLSKDPGSEDPALVQPLEGALYDLADFNLLLE